MLVDGVWDYKDKLAVADVRAERIGAYGSPNEISLIGVALVYILYNWVSIGFGILKGEVY